jgi:hypothetical protein
MRKKRLVLLRQKPEAERTFGTLMWGMSFLAHTLEPGDADVDHPRLPAGFYEAVPHGWDGESVRFKKTWALVGANVSAQPEPGIPRAAVLIHPMNTDEQTLGCIGVGMRRGEIRGEPAILDSRVAMDALRDLIGHDPFYLTIVEA